MNVRLFIILAILSSCPPELLDDDEYLDRVLRSAVRKSNLSLLGTWSKKFEPAGVTEIAVLGESHIALHSWPSQGQLFIDIATCSNEKSATLALREILAHFPGGAIASYRKFEMAGDSGRKLAQIIHGELRSNER